MKALIAALAVCLLATPALAQRGPQAGVNDRAGPPGFGQRQQPATLQASGDGSVLVVPDIAIVTIGVTTRGASAGEALRQNSTDLAAVIDTIRAEGVDDRDIGTAGFSVSPIYERRPDGARDDQLPRIVGYQVSNEVRVTIRDIATSGGILDKVVVAGANQVNGIVFDIADRKAAEDAAIEAAIGEARRRGGLMAAAAGVRLTRILTVNANAGGGPQPVFARMEMAADVPVMPGEQAVTANASITWEVEAE